MTGAKNTRESWDRYWLDQSDGEAGVYQAIAVFYRKFIIKPTLDRFLEQTFPTGAFLLHAGCGGGHMDADAVARYNVTALDISSNALGRYNALHGGRAKLINGDLFHLPVRGGTFDGIFNLGVMEHFSDDELDGLLQEFHRVLNKEGRLVLFWPPQFGLSVRVLKFVHFVLNDLLRRNIHLHPEEPSLLTNRHDIEARLARNGFGLEGFYFGARDLFTHAIVVARRDN